MIETDAWPRVLARWFTPTADGVTRAVRVIVIHDMEAPEKGDTAERIAAYFATMPDGRKASAHVTVDNNSVVQCVRDNDIAYGAPGANHDGIHIELAGYGSQSRGEWLDDYGRELLDRAGDVVAQYCLKYDIPIEHLSNDQLASGSKGIVGHAQVSAVYRLSDHTDPGPNFPWDYFIERIAEAFARRKEIVG